MLGGLFARNRPPVVPTVIEPVKIPGQEKRQEKERRWIESISYRGGASGGKRGTVSGAAGSTAASKQPLPAPVEHIYRGTTGHGGSTSTATTPTTTRNDHGLHRQAHHHHLEADTYSNQHVRSSSASTTRAGSSRGRLLDRWTGTGSNQGGHRRAHTAGSTASTSTSTSTSFMSRIGTLRSRSRDRTRSRNASHSNEVISDDSQVHLQSSPSPGSDGGFVHVPLPSSPPSLLSPPSLHPNHQHQLLHPSASASASTSASSSPSSSSNQSFLGQHPVSSSNFLAPLRRRPSLTGHASSSNRAKSVHLAGTGTTSSASPGTTGLSGQPGTSGSQSHPDLPSTSAIRHNQHSPSQVSPTHQNAPKSLALRLQELEHANAVGLLDDDEYRVLRQHLFETRANPSKIQADVTAAEASPTTTSISEFGAAAVQVPGTGYAALPHEIAAGKASVQRTGTLLGLQRLNMAQGDSRPPIDPPPAPPPPAAEPTALLPPSSSSTRSKSGRLSLRSARSNLTIRSTASRLSHIFRRGASTPASATGQDGSIGIVDRPPLPNNSTLRASGLAATASTDDAGMYSVPSSSHDMENKRKGKNKGSIPNDWKILQEQHALEADRDTRQGPRRVDSSAASIPANLAVLSDGADDTEIEIKLESQYRTMRSGSISGRGASMYEAQPADETTTSASDQDASARPATRIAASHSDPTLSQYLRDSSRRLPRIPSASFEAESGKGARNGPKDGTAPEDMEMGPPRQKVEIEDPMVKVRPRRSDSRLTAKTSHSSEQSHVSTLRMETIVQPGDELMSSKQLRHAIDVLISENQVLNSQFSDLQAQLNGKYGDPSLDALQAHAQRRRESMALQLEAARRLSTSSSLDSAQARSSVGHGSTHLGPELGASMSRRPSKASSIASSSMRRGLSSGSTQPSTFDTHITTRPPSTVQEELLFADIDAMVGGDHWNASASERARSQYDQELRALQERRQKVAERYSARLEYLEARLQGQLIKEKLRR